MRTIIFRGKHKEQWLFGDLRQDSDGTCYIFPTEAPNSPDNYTVDPETVGLFIGKYDNKGKKIYEGDYVYIYPTYKPYVVAFDNDNAQFIAKSMDNENEWYHFTLPQDYYRVEGNIHDRKEETK